MSTVLEIAYFLAMLSFIIGLKYLSYPQKAKLGNWIAGSGMTLAVIATIVHSSLQQSFSINLALILVAVALGTVLGKRISNRAEMTRMPQLVSYFNAMGAGCALLIGILEAQQSPIAAGRGAELVLIGALVIGGVSFSGSIVSYRKLAGKQKDLRTTLVGLLSKLGLALIVLIPVLVSLEWLQLTLVQEALVLAGVALLYGVIFVLPIGGADMPVVISLLNTFTGIATALSGIMFHNIIMISGGIFVGAAGVLLTLLMCRAMNRSLWNVLAGKFKGSKLSEGGSGEMDIRTTSIGELSTQLAFSSKVAIIPGYGLAVAQAQHLCSQLDRMLEANGVTVDYIIHPVAGRMPGHMNVLLAEADVDYSKLKEMEEVNHEMSSYDVAIVIGANDVVNPAAENDANSPIYGMPIIRAYESKQVVVIKRGMGKGYAGVENLLFGEPNCTMLFADGKSALNNIIGELKNLN